VTRTILARFLCVCMASVLGLAAILAAMAGAEGSFAWGLCAAAAAFVVLSELPQWLAPRGRAAG